MNTQTQSVIDHIAETPSLRDFQHRVESSLSCSTPVHWAGLVLRAERDMRESGVNIRLSHLDKHLIMSFYFEKHLNSKELPI